MVLRKVLASVLGVSQPDPSWFGNPANPRDFAGKEEKLDKQLMERRTN